MMKRIVNHVIDVIQNKTTVKKIRSSKWASVRAAHLQNHPTCAACDGTSSLEVHHIKPFHLQPELELDPTNLITLCESKKNGVNCHLLFGHLGSFRSYNVESVQDSAVWNDKLKKKPT